MIPPAESAPRRTTLCATALLALACAPRAVAVAPPPTVHAVVDAGPPPVPAAPTVDPRVTALLAAYGRSMRNNVVEVLLGPVDLRERGADAPRAAAVLRDGERTELVMTPVPFVEGSAASSSVIPEGSARDEIAELLVRDVDRDGREDLVVLLRRERVVGEDLPLGAFVRAFALETRPARDLAPMARAELLLLGVRDAAALDAALPTLNRFVPPSEGMSPARLLAQLADATPAEFRQAIAATGLRVCSERGLQQRTVRRCVHHPMARLTDALIATEIRPRNFNFAERLSRDFSGLGPPVCRRTAEGVACHAVYSANPAAGRSWSLVGEGASLRLAAVTAHEE